MMKRAGAGYPPQGLIVSLMKANTPKSMIKLNVPTAQNSTDVLISFNVGVMKTMRTFAYCIAAEIEQPRPCHFLMKRAGISSTGTPFVSLMNINTPKSMTKLNVPNV